MDTTPPVEPPVVPPNEPTPPTPTVEVEPPPVDISHSDVFYPDWDTQKHAFHNTRVLCDLLGMSLKDKNDLCACIWVESQFLIHAIGKPNTNGTQDFGLCQYNNGKIKGIPLWIGEGAAFESVDEVLNSPRKNVVIMIRTWQAGHRNWWVSFHAGMYLPFRDPASYTSKFRS